MKPDVYRQLQRHLDYMPVPFPETKSGVEISLLKNLFDEEEAYIALQLSALPESIDKIHGRFKDGEIYLIDTHISPYAYAHQLNHDPLRERKLLFHKSEIKKLYGKIKERGFSLIPLKLYFKNGKVKVAMAVAKGKRLHDKRESIKRKDIAREVEKEFREKKIKGRL